MQLKKMFLATALVVASATAGMAATFNLGDATNGATASETLVGAQTGDFFTFSLAPVAIGHVMNSIEINTVGSAFDTEIGLFDFNGDFVASNRNGGAGFGTASRLLFEGGSVLAPGSYTLAIGAWNINFGATIGDTDFNGFPSGAYNVNIATDVSPIPLPAGGLLLLSGLAGFAGVSRRKKNRA